MAQIEGRIIVGQDDAFRARLFRSTDRVGEFPDDREVPTIGCSVLFGQLPVYFESPVQLIDAGVELQRAGDQWQDELFRMAREGDAYLLPAERQAKDEEAVGVHEDVVLKDRFAGIEDVEVAF